MRCWSLKIKIAFYAAFITMAALFAGVVVMMVTLYFHQISNLDSDMGGDVEELVRDINNFRDAPKDPRAPLSLQFIPVDMRDYYLIIEGPEHQTLYRSDNLNGADMAVGVGQTRTLKLLGQASRIGAWHVDPYFIRAGAPLKMIEQFQKDLGIAFAAGLPAVGLVVFFGGLWLGRRAVAPVAALSSAAERISASSPHERLPLPSARDEIAKLTEVLNRTFDRLQSSYQVASRFSADASHQLKTPVTILRAGLDHLSHATDLSEAQAAEVFLLRQQTRRLSSLIDDLLLLSQADAGRVILQRESLDLKSLIQAAGDDLQVLVDGRGVSVEESLPEALPVSADRRFIGMVLQNLVENAAKYTPDGGSIRITGLREAKRVAVRIANTGGEISPEDRELIFERFRRGEKVGGGIQGYGLGLNIARELLRAHGGDLHLNPSEPGWVEFELRLPAC